MSEAWGEACNETMLVMRTHTHTHPPQVMKHCKEMSLVEADNTPLSLMEDNGP